MDSSLKTPFIIKKINLFSSWVHNLKKNTECTICRCHLNVPSLYNQEKGIDSLVVSGICNHSFHEECINPWVKTNNYCPICFQKWEFVKQDKQDEIVIELKKKKFIDPDIKNYISHKQKDFDKALNSVKNVLDKDLEKIPPYIQSIVNMIDKKVNDENKKQIIIDAKTMTDLIKEESNKNNYESDKEKIINIFKKNNKDLK